MTNKYDSIMSELHFRYVPGHIPISEDDIQRFECQLDHPLPDDYRMFLTQYGFSAGEPDILYPIADDPDGSEGAVEVFYGLNSCEYRDLRNIREVFLRRPDGRLPERLLAIASSPGGQMCISLAGDDRGAVYWWEQNGDNELTHVAHDFDNFMNSLRRVEG